MYDTKIDLELDESRYILSQDVTGNNLIIWLGLRNQPYKKQILVYDVTTGVKLGTFNIK